MTLRTQTAYAEGIGIRADSVVLEANLAIPHAAQGVVLFAHGSGSSRLSPRNQAVASTLNDSCIATLLIDLLTAEEESIDRVTAYFRFDIALLAQRLIGATDWLLHAPETHQLRIGYFGASTGAAAALVAAAGRPRAVGAIVSRGGRPDLAGPSLWRVQAPTLLIVGANDPHVIQVNRAAFAALQCQKRLEVVSGAAHLFEEQGSLERVADLACEWFKGHLAA